MRKATVNLRLPRRLVALEGTLQHAAPRVAAVEDEIAALRPLIRLGDVCLDVGAKHGAYALMMAAATGVDGQVFAFEPGPAPRRVIRSGCRLLGAKHVTVVPKAVSDFNGSSELCVPKRRGLDVPGRSFVAAGTVGLGSNVEFRRHRTVLTDVVTLDKWSAQAGVQHVDVVKIDVEGAEGAVLGGAFDLFQRSLPIVLVELEDRHLARFGTTAREVMEILTELGYQASVWVDDRWQPMTTPSLRYRNHLFQHPDRLAA
ncbi:MAG: FkbM family methyltransferase [Nitriliruptoraceae bacterium]